MKATFLAYLLTGPGLVALVGQNIAWSWRLQGAPLPAVTLIRTDGREDMALDGFTGFVDGYVQADCWGSTQLMADQVAGQIKALTRVTSPVILAATGGVIQGVFVMHEADEFEGEKPDRIFRTRLSLRIPHLVS